MTPSALSFLLICTLMATVRGQSSSIVSTNTITSGGKFTVTCESSKANPPQDMFSVQTLTIFRNLTSSNSFSTVAQYHSLSPPGLNKTFMNNPDGRNWIFTFSGDNNGAAGNANSMRIVWDVNDASCTDAGIYRCQITYNLKLSLTTTVLAPDQNVTAITGLSNLAIKVDPNQSDFAVDDNITFTCSARGPATGVNFKWELWAKGQFDTDQEQSLPANNGIENKLPVLQSGNTGCVQYYWESTLSLQVPADYDQQTYKCIVTYLQQQESGNLTIGVIKPVPAAASATSDPNVGMIVGIIIGCLVAIAIVVGIIFFLRYRKRSQQNGSGNKDEHDTANDANLHAPPPVFYPSSKQSKASKDEKDTKTPKESERRETPHYNKNENSRNQKSNDRNYNEDNYNYEHEANGVRRGRRNHQGDSRQDNRYARDEQHYASTDVSHSGDDSADFSDSPLDGRSKPRPKRRSQPTRREGKDGPRSLHYAELDLPKKMDGSESGSDAGRRREKPVEYAEIRV